MADGGIAHGYSVVLSALQCMCGQCRLATLHGPAPLGLLPPPYPSCVGVCTALSRPLPHSTARNPLQSRPGRPPPTHSFTIHTPTARAHPPMVHTQQAPVHLSLAQESAESGNSFSVMQPGSSVATALSEGEAQRKHVVLLEAMGQSVGALTA